MKIAVAMVEKDDFFHENHSKTVFVKYLPSFADDKDLYEAFGKHGKLLFCEVYKMFIYSILLRSESKQNF